MRNDPLPISMWLEDSRRALASHAYQHRFIAADPNNRPCNPCRERVALSFHGAVIRACFYGPSGTADRVFAFLKEYGLIPKRPLDKSACLSLLDRAIIVAKKLEQLEGNRMIRRQAA